MDDRTYVHDWQSQIPSWSLWQPGSPGKYNCAECLGTGWLRRELHATQQEFGRLIFCECVPQNLHAQLSLGGSRGGGKE